MATRTTTKRKLSDEPNLLRTFVTLPLEELHKKIAARAYELFLARNGSGGDATSDWLLAEEEILKLTVSPVTASDNPATTNRKRATTTKSTASRSSKSKPTAQARSRKQSKE